MQQSIYYAKANNQQRLTEDLILAMGKRLMRELGVSPSIRGLALALNVEQEEIAHYFKDRQSILNAIITSLMANFYQQQISLDWRKSVHALSLNYLTLLRHYDGLLSVLALLPEDSPIQTFSKHLQQIIAPLQLPSAKHQHALLLLRNLLHGLALIPQRDHQQSDFDALIDYYCNAISH